MAKTIVITDNEWKMCQIAPLKTTQVIRNKVGLRTNNTEGKCLE